MRKPNTNERTAHATLRIAANLAARKTWRDDINLPDGDFRVNVGRGTIAMRAYRAALLRAAGYYRRECFWLNTSSEYYRQHIDAARGMLAAAKQLRVIATH